MGILQRIREVLRTNDQNRVTYAANCLPAEIGGKRVLVETGNGNK